MERSVNLFFGFSSLGILVQLEMEKKLVNVNYSFPTTNPTTTLCLINRERKGDQEGTEIKRLEKSINFIYFEQAKWGNNHSEKGFSDFTWTSSHHRNTLQILIPLLPCKHIQ